MKIPDVDALMSDQLLNALAVFAAASVESPRPFTEKRGATTPRPSCFIRGNLVERTIL
jgi:hypothetical protein